MDNPAASSSPQTLDQVIANPQATPDTTAQRILIVTLFARTHQPKTSTTSDEPRPFDYEDVKTSFTSLLTRLAPFIQPPILTKSSHSTTVIRLIYTLHLLPNDPIPPINTWSTISSQIPATPEIATFEASHSCELIIDFLPPPSRSHLPQPHASASPSSTWTRRS
ncbi:phosphoserine phosphatase [Physcia stellaris]|nr:phosphoserine phosphatase [Physcia stellaris]